MTRRPPFSLPLAGLFLLASLPLRAADTAWKPAEAPLMTRWAKDVSPKNARPEYPRPNAVRKEWQNLNGLWEFAFDDNLEGKDKGWTTGHPFDDKILVPWTFEAALSGIGKGKEVHEHVWYRREFTVPDGWRERRTLLHFDAVDWQAEVYLNGRKVGMHWGGYAPFVLDVTDALKKSGQQELVVAVYDPADPKKGAYQPKGKQLGSEGIWYTRTTGIWQTVWLEPVSNERIAGFTLRPVLNEGKLLVGTVTAGQGDLKLTVKVAREGKTVAQKSIPIEGTRSSLELPVKAPQAWSPETPTLYDVTLTLKKDGKTTDEIKSYCAFREVGIADGRITLNGKPYFLKGVLDQGFWPDGIYTPPTDEAIQNDVKTTIAFGFNLARKHVKVEDPRWYYWCDKLGLLVAQDMPSSHNLASDEAKLNFTREWKEVMAAVRAHPSVILWITFNENWGDPKEFQDEIVRMTRESDPSRPIIDASGWTQRGLTDITDIHDYGNDLKKHALFNPPKPRWIGEYGGVALPIEGHTWISGWGYQTVHTPSELLAKYRLLTDQINGAPGLSGFVYTQLTDVEQELNGLMTYDRMPKAPPEQFAAINAGKSQSASR